MMSLKRKNLCLCFLLVMAAVLGLTGTVTAVEDPNLEYRMPGTIEGTGTLFEVNDSNYLNIIFQSSEPVHLMLESVPKMVVMQLEAADGATLTQITLTGFAPSTTYYKYEDNYHNGVTFATDANGSYSYTQDLNEPHLVFTQEHPSTKFIPADTSIGTWDSVNRIYTLTTDVSETIQIEEDNLTLDGAGHMVNGSGSSGIGIFLHRRTGVTVKNMNVQGFSYGIYVDWSTGNTLTGNTVSNNSAYGIYVSRGSSDNSIVDNTTTSNRRGGISLRGGFNNTLLCNIISNSGLGIYLYRSYYGTLTGNTVSSNSAYGIYVYQSNANTFRGNTFSNNYLEGVHLYQSHYNEIYSNNFIDNNPEQACVEGRSNLFNLPEPIGGNYWSNWTGPDDNNDGFVDAPYVFVGGQDNLPLVSEVPSPCNQTPIADADGPYIVKATTWDGAEVQLDGTGSYDQDGVVVTYQWDLDLQFDSDFDGDSTNDADATGPSPVCFFPLGQRDISLVVEDDQGAMSEPDATTVSVSIVDIGIDIKPGSFPNSINLGSNGVIPVAFLTTPDFDALTIYPLTITLRGEDFADGLVKLRGKKDAKPMASPEDVDGDGDLDLLVHLDTEKLADYELDVVVTLGAKTTSGYVVSGSDTIHIVPE